MNDTVGDWITLFGLLLTLLGAGITARAVILKEDDAVNIGITRIASNTKEGNLKFPMMQNLLNSSRSAKRGLTIIAAGTALQALPVAIRLVTS